MKPKFHSSTRSIRFHIALAAIACGAALTTPAMAGDSEPLTKVVSYADLNMNAEAGVRTLYGRLRMAARQVCAPFRGGNSLRERTNYSECFSPALASSVAKVDEPALTAYHLSRTDTTEPSRVAKDQ